MRVITHCPACQTQFFATEEQLNQHGGKVRCGQCLQVFDANAQLITVTESAEDSTEGIIATNNISAISNTTTAQAIANPETPAISEDISSTDNVADSAKQQPSFLGDAFNKKKLRPNYASGLSRTWLWVTASLLLILIGCIQSVYFLRNEIAIYYPNTKPYLLQACQKLACNIDLPKKIDSIVIDDSDMQEDANHSGLIRFSSSLINNDKHVLAYPNLELTLTDVEDKPVLRRIFKPDEYLPAGTNIADGIQAGTETRINLSITTGDTAVAGYRVFVTY